MKILACVGSKRKNGNTHTLVKQAMEQFDSSNSIDIVTLSDYNFEGCTGCEGCAMTNECVIQDDMQILYGKIDAADLLILASPTYYYNITADIFTFI
ncbi:MAG: flavodoxin family protein [Candidatus Izemoplasma sp.]|nr:flavodoxin family protein [Candidatus Izemoplasma sp.]